MFAERLLAWTASQRGTSRHVRQCSIQQNTTRCINLNPAYRYHFLRAYAQRQVRSLARNTERQTKRYACPCIHACMLQPSNHASKHRRAGKGVSGPAQRRSHSRYMYGYRMGWARICLFGMHGDLMGCMVGFRLFPWWSFRGVGCDGYIYTYVHIRRRYT